jgi:outer membrane protein OmpA-like peptidoglycan-associated protein
MFEGFLKKHTLPSTKSFCMPMRTFLFFCGFTLAAITGFSQSYSVYFKTDKSTIEPAAQQLLDSLLRADVFKSRDSLNIRCHCDVRADSAYNYALSMRRAQSVQAYLQKSGVKSAMHLSAFGEVTPAYPNTETLRYKNRRCDIELKSPPKTKPAITTEEFDVKDWSEGFTMRLEGLEFVGNQAVPYWEGMPVLYKLLWDLTTYPDVEIALHGHVCCGDDMPLSIARAKAVYDFLVANNIDSNRLSYAGFSNSRPLVEEVDEITQKHNRRVEIVVVKEPNSVIDSAPKPLVFNVALRDIPWDGRNNVPTYEGNYNLDLLAKMMARSKGYRYTIRVYAVKSSQISSRITYLNNYFLRKRVTTNKLRLIKGEAPRYQNLNMLTLEVIPVK